jgi:hypothetical protein
MKRLKAIDGRPMPKYEITKNAAYCPKASRQPGRATFPLVRPRDLTGDRTVRRT